MGYHRAGFDVVGVDVRPQPRYPFAFHQANALAFPLDGFDAIHASPPCQAFSTIAKQQRTRRRYDHPDLYASTRDRLEGSGAPWIIENVPGSPLATGVVLCGSMFGLDVRRHRLFEASFLMLAPTCEHGRQRPRFRSLDKRRHARGAPLTRVVGVHGHCNYAGELDLRRHAMGIPWMESRELSQAIPPAYTEWIGRQLLATLGRLATARDAMSRDA